MCHRSSKKKTKDIKILMVGLGDVGKTTILYRITLGETVNTIPTTAYNLDTIKYNNKSFKVWDLGGQDENRPKWEKYFKDTQGIIYVIDSSDSERISENKKELHKILDHDELRYAALLVLANKQDIPNAMPANELAAKLSLVWLDRPWHVQETCGRTALGLDEGLDWLLNELI